MSAMLGRAVCLAWLLLVLVAGPALAQEDPPPDAPPAAPSWPAVDLGGLGQAVAGAIFAQAGDWLEQWLKGKGLLVLLEVFLSALGWLGQRLFGGMHASGATDLLTALNLELTLDNPTVRHANEAARGLFNAVVGAGVVAAGFAVLLRFGGVVASEVGELLPRIALGALLVNASLDVVRGGATVSNGVAAYLAGAEAGAFGQRALAQLPADEAGATLLVVGVMAALLLLQRLMMHAVLDLLAMTAPLAFAAWVIPMWSRWFWRWASLLVALLVGGVLQALLLAAGAGMLAWAASGGWGTDGTRLLSGAVAAAVLLLAVVAPALVGVGLVGGVATAAHWRTARGGGTPATPTATPPLPSGSPSAPARDVGSVEDVEDAAWTPRPGRLAPREGGGRSEAPILVYEPISVRTLPPRAAGAVPALPPPNYLRD
jgi:hypothetical protein